MSIFNKPINEITYDDVVSFCQQGIAEGINLDYKKDFPPSGLEKTISAFANSFGGVIIIGIADEDSKPKPPFEGIDYKDKLEERIWNIILDNINPPVFPEIRVCPPKDNKTFVIIRIPQSNETPHAILNNTYVYLRTGNRNKPEDIATIEQIEWLMDRRKKSEKLRETLYRRAEERYQNICNIKKLKNKFGEFTLSFAPIYPQKPLALVENIEAIVNQIKVRSSYGEFPLLINQLQPVQDGVVHFFLNETNGLITHTEFNKFGLVLYKETLGRLKKETQESEVQKMLYMHTIIDRLDISFEAMGKFYHKVGYWGLVGVNFSLQGLLGIKFIPLIPQNSLPLLDLSDITNNAVEKQLSWSFEASVTVLNDPIARQNKLLEIGKDIAWSFGVKVSDKTIKEKLQEGNRWVEVS